MKTVYPLQTKFAGGIKKLLSTSHLYSYLYKPLFLGQKSPIAPDGGGGGGLCTIGIAKSGF